MFFNLLHYQSNSVSHHSLLQPKFTLYSLALSNFCSLDKLESTILVGHLSGAVLLFPCVAFFLQHHSVGHNRNNGAEQANLQGASRWFEVFEVIHSHGLEARQTGIELRRQKAFKTSMRFIFQDKFCFDGQRDSPLDDITIRLAKRHKHLPHRHFRREDVRAGWSSSASIRYGWLPGGLPSPAGSAVPDWPSRIQFFPRFRSSEEQCFCYGCSRNTF